MTPFDTDNTDGLMKCPACNGVGCLTIHETVIDEPCPYCAGEGTDPDYDELPCGEQACLDVQRAMAERKPREVERIDLDFRKGAGK